jgi:hypothetical protein
MTASSLTSNLSVPRLTSLHRILICLALIVGILFQFGVAWMLRKQIALGFSDFSAFYTAGKIVAAGDGGHLYDLATQARVEGAFTVRSTPTSFLPYVHAPFQAVLFAPLAIFSYSTAFWIWWACNLLLSYLVLFLLRPRLACLNTRLDLAILGLGFFLPLLATECQGQDSVLTLVLFTVCFVNLARGRAWIAGSALALASNDALVMIAILAVTSERRWRILAGYFQTCFGLAILSAFLPGWRACAAYPGFIEKYAAGFDDAKEHTYLMPNLRGLMYSMFGSHTSHHAFMLLVGAAFVVCVLAAIWALQGKGATVQEMHLHFALVVSVTQVVTYHEFLHDMTMLLLPLFLVWNSLSETGLHTWKRRLLAASVLLCFCRIFLPIQFPQIDACLAIAFFALLCWELGGAKGQAIAYS